MQGEKVALPGACARLLAALAPIRRPAGVLYVTNYRLRFDGDLPDDLVRARID